MKIYARVNGAEEFLAAVPALLGYHPLDSVVVVPFCGGSSLGAMRFDLPAPRQTWAQLATMAIGFVCRLSDATGFALIVYGGARLEEGWWRDIQEHAAAAGLEILDALVVENGYWSRIGTRSEPLPVSPTPDELSDMVTERDQHSGADLPAVRPDLAAEVARLINEGSAGLSAEEMLCLFERALAVDAHDMNASDHALLARCLTRPALRDVALLQWAHGQSAGVDALQAQLAWEEGRDYPKALAAVMWGEGARPDPQRIERALGVCMRTVALTPIDNQPGVLAAAAWLSWSLGRSTHAYRHAQHALGIESGHGLAGIVASFVIAGFLPDWGFRRSSA